MNLSRLALVPAVVICCSVTTPALAAGCPATHWVGTWAAAPSDASAGLDISDLFDPSAHLKTPIDNQTVRVIVTPSRGGTMVRVHLSNRFGKSPVKFARTTVARQATGAAVAAESLKALTFGGQASVTVAPGNDVTSDPAPLDFKDGQHLAISTYVAGAAGNATEHYTGRQTSYLGSGDHAADASANAFSTPTTTRPFVAGVDVMAAGSVGTVVAFGDSITDGYEAALPTGVPEQSKTVDRDGRWPDVLARRLSAAGRELSVVNAGISGNRVLHDGVDGGQRDTYGPDALERLDADVLSAAGVTTVIWLEGINDLGQPPNADAQSVIGGYERGIARMHAAGLRVVMGTLTPAGGASGAYGTAAVDAQRRAINTWIRTSGVPDAFVDFDKAVRDPSDPTRIAAAFDGSDHLHFNPAGYKAMGDAVDLDLLSGPSCAAPLKVSVTPRRVTARRAVALRVVVTQAGRAVSGAMVRLGAARRTTNARGVAVLRVRLSRSATLSVKVKGGPARRLRIRVTSA